MKRKAKKVKATAVERERVEAMREGRINRASTWSANGERKNPRKNRRDAKADLRKYI